MTFALSLVLLLLVSSDTAQTIPSTEPRVFLLDAKVLAQQKDLSARRRRNDPLVKAARTAADRAMGQGPFSVMQKQVVPPSGDKHDYMSQAPYFWPNPNTPNGLPYVRRDGERNPEIREIPDHDNFGRMSSDVQTLALAYYLTGEEAYADRAVLLLRAWFLDPATRMNPNLEYAQGIPGINTGRGIGIIESRVLTSVVDAIGLLAGAKNWTGADAEGMKKWLGSFLNWLQTSEHGKAEAAAKNNHGTYYDLQVSDIALFLGQRELAKRVLQQVTTKRIAQQIEPDGRQPLELARTRAFSYSAGNLEGLMELAELGDQVGVDLWNFSTADGRSIRAALDFLLPHATGGKKWPYQQIRGFARDELRLPLLRAAAAYKDPKYEAAAARLSRPNDDVRTLLRWAVLRR